MNFLRVSGQPDPDCSRHFVSVCAHIFAAHIFAATTADGERKQALGQSLLV